MGVLNLEEMLAQSSSTTLAGLGGDAKSGVTKEEAKTFADQSVAALAAAVQRGAVVPSELREPDQGGVRGRAVAGEEVIDGSSADLGAIPSGGWSARFGSICSLRSVPSRRSRS
jgi:hypothetical protein